MPSQTKVKEFSVERQLRMRRLQGPEGATSAQVLQAIEELRQEVRALRLVAPEVQASEGVISGEKEALAARVEIAQMVRVIGQAKMEIATIRHPKAEDDRMGAAASELDAIVLATETSTEDILAASEQIEHIVRRLTGLHPDDEEVATMSEQIANEIIRIFEACNFQDITGQRVNKVVRTIRFIEERILAMIDIWGVDAFAELPLPEQPVVEGDEALMSGPQLPNQGISQDDINALFD